MSEFAGKISIVQFLHAERERLTGFVRRLIDDAGDRDGEDIVQDVALSLLNRADVLMPIETISAYVYRPLRNRVIDYLRNRKNTISVDKQIDDEDGMSPSYHLIRCPRGKREGRQRPRNS